MGSSVGFSSNVRINLKCICWDVRFNISGVFLIFQSITVSTDAFQEPSTGLYLFRYTMKINLLWIQTCLGQAIHHIEQFVAVPQPWAETTLKLSLVFLSRALQHPIIDCLLPKSISLTSSGVGKCGQQNAQENVNTMKRKTALHSDSKTKNEKVYIIYIYVVCH